MGIVDRTVKPSFTKSLFLGQMASELVMPYPTFAAEERTRVDAAVASAKQFLTEEYDPWKAERDGWVGDDVIRELGDRKLTGLFIDEKYGGLGLSQTGYCRVMEEFGRVDGTLSVVMGVHQSIGSKPLYLYGTDDQKERWLPDLASGRKLAAFVLTEPNVGSDAYNLETRAERQADGSWILNGEKRWIGNGDKDVPTSPSSSRRAQRDSPPDHASKRWGSRPTTFSVCTSTTCGCPPRTCSVSLAMGSALR
jgi:acyl-CoA dehydrogenase family protein 9